MKMMHRAYEIDLFLSLLCRRKESDKNEHFAFSFSFDQERFRSLDRLIVVFESLSENTPGVWSDRSVCYFIFFSLISLLSRHDDHAHLYILCPDDMMSAHREQTIAIEEIKC